MQQLAGWIAAGESGSVVGLTGCGRSNLLGFLCHRPDALRPYLPPQTGPVALIPVDLNNLPNHHLSTLYRTILHAFYWVRDNFDPPLKQLVADLYTEHKAVRDSFLTQRVLYDLLQAFQVQQMQVVLVMNRFDRFCHHASPPMVNTLRGLRDSFKDTLCYIVGMGQDVVYLSDPEALGDMYELLDIHVCRVGAMNPADARQMVDSLLHPAQPRPNPAEIEAMLGLSGRFPVLLKAIVYWWLLTPDRPRRPQKWADLLMKEDNIQYRLTRIWEALTQEEQLALAEVHKLQMQAGATGGPLPQQMPPKLVKSFQTLAVQQGEVLRRLAAKGMCSWADPGWWINGTLMTAYIAGVAGRVRGRVWVDQKSRIVYQGDTPLDDLTGLQYEILNFLTNNPHIKHTRDDVIDNTWPEEEQREGITPNALHVHIAGIRKKIEPNPAQPQYLITWHGRPGGYQFFPEGKPK